MIGRGWSEPTWRAHALHVANALPGSAFDARNGDPSLGDVVHLNADTRTLHHPAHAVFFAIQGPWHDGHDHVREAWQRGVRRFVVSRPLPADVSQSSDVLQTPDVLLAMQHLAHIRRAAFPGPVIGITGSNGKTIVKEWVATLLPERLAVHKSPLSHNSQLGVPLTVWTLQSHHDVSLVEAGISLPGEMARLADCVQPTEGVLTHLGEAHLGNFDDRQALAREKCRLFVGCERVFMPWATFEELRSGGAWAWLQEACRDRGVCEPEALTWALGGDALPPDARTHLVAEPLAVGGWQLTFDSPEGPVAVRTSLPFSDPASLHNAFTAALVACHHGATPAELAANLARLHPLDRRLASFERPGGGHLLLDDCSHDLGGLAVALDALDALGRTATPSDSSVLPRVAVVGDIPQSGLDEPARAEALADLASAAQLSHLWMWVPAWLPETRRLFEAKLAAQQPNLAVAMFDRIDVLESEARALGGAHVLVKSATSDRLTKVVHALAPPRHVTTLTLDAGALVSNLRILKAHVGATTVVAVLKGLAYGTDPAVLGRLLEGQGVDWLAVAYAEEGVALRNAGINARILVLNPDASTLDTHLAHRLEPEVVSLEHLRQVNAWAVERRVNAFPIHLKLDTGMRRLGLAPEDDAAAANLIAQGPLVLATVLSHLAAADDPAHDDRTRAQIHAFHFRASTHFPKAVCHVLNSAGAARVNALATAAERATMPCLRAVRVGLGMYGLGVAADHLELAPVLQLESVVAKLVHVPAGEGTGYGWTDAADHDRTLAVLSVGYADGYPRNLGNGRAHVTWQGHRLPTVGRVCMDMMTVDVTGTAVQPGDVVRVWGDEPRLDELATWAGTISYELLTRIGPRVQRRVQR